MWFLRRHWPLARAGWRDLDDLHARPNESTIQKPWRRTNSNRGVFLTDNALGIADAGTTPFQVGGVSYEKMAFTSDWGCEYLLWCDGNVLQQQFWAACISPSWAKVGFNSLIGQPMIAIHRDVASAVETVRIMVYRSLAEIDTLVSTGSYTGMMNGNWVRWRIEISRDRLVRVFVNNVMVLQYWLPASLASGPNRRAMNFLNQTFSTSWQRDFYLFDSEPLVRVVPWILLIFDTFNRPNGSVGNGWTQLGANAGIVNNSWSTTGTTDGGRALIRNTGSTNGVQRVQATIGGNIAPNANAGASIILRANSAGTAGLAATFFSDAVVIDRWTGAITDREPTWSRYTSTGISISNNTLVSFSCTAEAAWVEVDGQVVLVADLNGQVPVTGRQWAGLRVVRQPLINSASWNSASVYMAA